jgi:hypothetical protein
MESDPDEFDPNMNSIFRHPLPSPTNPFETIPYNIKLKGSGTFCISNQYLAMYDHSNRYYEIRTLSTNTVLTSGTLQRGFITEWYFLGESRLIVARNWNIYKLIDLNQPIPSEAGWRIILPNWNDHDTHANFDQHGDYPPFGIHQMHFTENEKYVVLQNKGFGLLKIYETTNFTLVHVVEQNNKRLWWPNAMVMTIIMHFCCVGNTIAIGEHYIQDYVAPNQYLTTFSISIFDIDLGHATKTTGLPTLTEDVTQMTSNHKDLIFCSSDSLIKVFSCSDLSLLHCYILPDICGNEIWCLGNLKNDNRFFSICKSKFSTRTTLVSTPLIVKIMYL